MAEAEEVIEEVEEVEEVEEQSAAWREDWRTAMAGDDEKALEQLGRYADPTAVWTKARALEQKLSSGEYKQTTPFPDKGSDEEKASWRANNQIPDSFDKYDIGREIKGETDEDIKAEQAVIDRFLEFAHSKNMPGDHVKNMVDFFYSRRDEDADAAAEASLAVRNETEENLRAEWGTDYRGHLNRVNNLIETAPADIKEGLLDAMMLNGTTLRDSPEAMKFLLGLAIMQNPVTTVVPQGGDQLSSIQDEIDEIKGKMNTKEYRNSPKMKQRYRDLLEAHGNLSKGK